MLHKLLPFTLLVGRELEVEYAATRYGWGVRLACSESDHDFRARHQLASYHFL